MATDRQTDANRQNAQKSTGPRTAEGKARSSLNHVTTGIDAQSAVIPGEDPAQLQALSDRYFAEFQPATEDERHQVDILVRCDWQARRFDRCEAQTWSRSMEGPIRRNEPNQLAEGFALCQKAFERLDRRVEKNEHLYNRARRELDELQSIRRAAQETENAAEAAAAEPIETEAPTEELGSNLQTRPESPDPNPATPKFGPQSASDLLEAPDQAPPETA